MQNAADRRRRGGVSVRWVRVGLVGAITGGLVAFIGTQGATAAHEFTNPANAWILKEGGAAIATRTAAPLAGDVFSTALYTGAQGASAGATATGAGLIGATGSTILGGLGALIGLGMFPAVKGLFGSGGNTAALPAAGGSPPGNANCTGTGYTGTAYSMAGGATVGGQTMSITSCSMTGTASPASDTITITAGSKNTSNWVTVKQLPGGSCYTYGSTGSGTSLAGKTLTFPRPAAESFEFYNDFNLCASANKYVGAYIARTATLAANTNPLRWIESTGECKLPDGTVTTVTTSSSTFTREVGATGAQTSPAAPEVVCPAGQLLTSGKAEIVTTGSPTRVPLGDVYQVDPELSAGLLGGYSACLSAVCNLHIQRLTSDPQLDCSSVHAGAGHPCRNWSTDPAMATKYGCRYGTNIMPLASCSGLKLAYGADPVIAPNTGAGAAPAPVAPDIESSPTADQTPGLESSGCVPSGFALLNPFWVFKAMGCALKWAFVPKVAPGFGAINTLVQARAPFSIITGAAGAIGSFSSGLGAAGSCSALPDFTPPTLSNNHELQLPCAGPSGITGWSALYTTMQLLLWLAGGMGLMAMVRADISPGQV